MNLVCLQSRREGYEGEFKAVDPELGVFFTRFILTSAKKYI